MGMRRPSHPLSKGFPSAWRPIVRVELPDGSLGELIEEHANGKLVVRRNRDGVILEVKR
jgi:hypothetical protein